MGLLLQNILSDLMLKKEWEFPKYLFIPLDTMMQKYYYGIVFYVDMKLRYFKQDVLLLIFKN